MVIPIPRSYEDLCQQWEALVTATCGGIPDDIHFSDLIRRAEWQHRIAMDSISSSGNFVAPKPWRIK